MAAISLDRHPTEWGRRGLMASLSSSTGPSAVAASGLLRARAAAADKAMRGVFPRYVAEALQRGERPAPERKDMVTVFFSDVVGFTALSAAMEAQQVGRRHFQ